MSDTRKALLIDQAEAKMAAEVKAILSASQIEKPDISKIAENARQFLQDNGITTLGYRITSAVFLFHKSEKGHLVEEQVIMDQSLSQDEQLNLIRLAAIRFREKHNVTPLKDERYKIDFVFG